MNQRIKKLFARFIRGAPAALALAALWTATAPLNAEAALAGSAGNTIIRNTITVNYSDAKGAGQTPVSATLDLTVNTVSAAPTILAILTSPGSTDGTGAQTSYTFRIRTNSNGPRSVSFTTADGNFGTNLATGTVPSPASGSLFLGATTIDPLDSIGTIASWAVNATYTFKVPTDGGIPSDTAETAGTTSDGVINGLKNGDIVWLYSGSAYYGPFSVGTVTETAVGSITPCTIQLTNNLGAGVLTNVATATGWQIVEEKDVTVTVTQGIDTNLLASPTWDTTLTATMGTFSANTPIAITSAHSGHLTVDKYVRNVTQSGMTGSTPSGSITFTAGGTYGPYNYWKTGITGAPGDTLEYLAVITDNGTGNSLGVLASDVVPTYSTLVNFPTNYGAAPGSGTIFAHAKLMPGAVETDLKTDNSPGNAGAAYGKTTVAAGVTTMTFYLGTGLSTPTPSAGGQLIPATTVYVIYQVKIN